MPDLVILNTIIFPVHFDMCMIFDVLSTWTKCDRIKGFKANAFFEYRTFFRVRFFFLARISFFCVVFLLLLLFCAGSLINFYHTFFFTIITFDWFEFWSLLKMEMLAFPSCTVRIICIIKVAHKTTRILISFRTKQSIKQQPSKMFFFFFLSLPLDCL